MTCSLSTLQCCSNCSHTAERRAALLQAPLCTSCVAKSVFTLLFFTAECPRARTLQCVSLMVDRARTLHTAGARLPNCNRLFTFFRVASLGISASGIDPLAMRMQYESGTSAGNYPGSCHTRRLFVLLEQFPHFASVHFDGLQSKIEPCLPFVAGSEYVSAI